MTTTAVAKFYKTLYGASGRSAKEEDPFLTYEFKSFRMQRHPLYEFDTITVRDTHVDSNGVGVTDFEHDTASLFLVELVPFKTEVGTQYVEIVGVVNELRAWEDLSVPESRLEECGSCTLDGGHRHMMGEYLPPHSPFNQNEFARSYVRIEIDHS